VLACGQSTLDFPRAIPPSELATTGFAIVNPGASPADVTFTLYAENGSVEKVANQRIAARGQLARAGRELFPDAANRGWVQATSLATGLQGFWVGGDFATVTDGAAAAPSSIQMILPFVAPDSEIHVANTGTDDVTLLIEAFGEDGHQVGQEFPQFIGPKGFFRSHVAGIFPRADLSQIRYIKLRCVNPFAAVVIVRNYAVGPSWAAVNGVPASVSLTEINFPHAVDGQLGSATYQSTVVLTNLSDSANDLVITFTSEAGSPLASVQRTLQGNGALRVNLRNLFALPAGFQSGWIRVSGSLPVTGVVVYADSAAGGVAVVPLQAEAQRALLFAHIAELVPWWTGLALLNTSSSDADVKIFALSPNNTLIGSARFVLPAGAKTAKLLSEWIPQTQKRAADGGFVFVESDVGLYGIELFFTRDLRILSNVAAGRIVPGITYTPPPLQ
jgi:hypothetical protein